MKLVAALYIDTIEGPYASMPGVECWGEGRDARLYRGPHPVVAHPPCQAWGQMRYSRLHLTEHWGVDELDRDARHMACGPIAVSQVRRFGGVLEQPAGSALWQHADLPMPGLFIDSYGGWSVEVAQGAYGHPAPKRTWLYIVGVEPGSVEFKPFHDPGGRVESQWSTRRHITPPEFAALLVRIARAAQAGVSA